MRQVDRGRDPSPAGLGKKDKTGLTELDRAIGFYTTAQTTSFDFAAYKAEDVKRRLEELFHGKCAYCESHYSSTAPVDIEHFRPKGAVEGTDLPGYWWLAMEWTNLLPSCIDCNRRRKQPTPVPAGSLETLSRSQIAKLKTVQAQTGKKDAFPLATGQVHATWDSGKHSRKELPSLALETPLLINPCNEDPEREIVFFVDRGLTVSLVLPTPVGGAEPGLPDPLAPPVDAAFSRRGAVSIQVYGLNRLGLVQARTWVLRDLEFLSTLALDLYELADKRETELGGEPAAKADDMLRKLRYLADQIVDRMRRMADPEAPYSSVAKAWMKRFAGEFS